METLYQNVWDYIKALLGGSSQHWFHTSEKISNQWIYFYFNKLFLIDKLDFKSTNYSQSKSQEVIKIREEVNGIQNKK
jgi:hypothetical protein